MIAAPAAGQVQEEASRLYDGAEFAYEHLVLQADRVLWRLRGLAGSGRAVLNDLQMLPEVDGHVTIDSRASRLPGISGRLLLVASRIAVTCLEETAALLRYHLSADLSEPVTGEVLIDGHWSPTRMACAALDIDLQIGIDAGRLIDPGLTAIVMRSASAEHPVDLAITMDDGGLQLRSALLKARCHPQFGIEQLNCEGPSFVHRRLVDEAGETLFAIEAKELITLPNLHAQRERGQGIARGAVHLEALGARLEGEQLAWELARDAAGEARVVTFELIGGDDGVRIAGDGGRLPVALRMQARRINGKLISDGEGGPVYEVVIEGGAPFVGRLRQGEEWIPFEGRAAVITARLRDGAGGLADLLLLRFEGDDQTAELTVHHGSWPGRFQASRLQWRAGDTPETGRFESSADAVFEGLGQR